MCISNAHQEDVLRKLTTYVKGETGGFFAIISSLFGRPKAKDVAEICPYKVEVER